MKMKRGTDHYWDIRKYLGDIALYAHCNCGFQYNCSSSKNTWNLVQEITNLYQYCPFCGARKKYYNNEPTRIEKYSWE